MKYYKVLPISIFLLIPLFSYGASSKVIKCPQPPKNQPIVNYFLTSFTDPSENLQNYIPRDLVLVSKNDTYKNGHYCLRKPVYAAFKRMNKAIKKETGMSLKIRSGFRSYKVQTNFKNIYGSLAASPGRSEHQLGTAIDLIGSTEGEKLIDSKEYTWLQKNAARYGFVQSYPNETINESTDNIDTLQANLQANASQINTNNLPSDQRRVNFDSTQMSPVTDFDKSSAESPIVGEAWHWRYIGEATAISMPQINLGKYLDQVKIEQIKNKK